MDRERDLVLLPKVLEACRHGLFQGVALGLPGAIEGTAEGHVELGLPEGGLRRDPGREADLALLHVA